jgi:hypothetical protein
LSPADSRRQTVGNGGYGSSYEYEIIDTACRISEAMKKHGES